MKSRCVLLLSTLAVVACSAAPTPRPTRAVPDLRRDQVDATDGSTLYGNLCASCHGVDARGGGPVAEALSVAMPDLTRLSARHGGEFPLARVEAAIRGPQTLEIHGGPQMPLWGPALEGVLDDLPQANRQAFAANRIRKISRYLESLQIESE